MPTIAPWLQTGPRDFIAAAERGSALGQSAKAQRDRVAIANSQLAQEASSDAQHLEASKQRLAQAERQSQMQAAAAAEQNEREFLQNKHRTDVEDNYNRARIGVEKQKLRNDAVIAARKMSASRKLAALVTSGIPLDKAMLQVPELMGPGVLTEMMQTGNREPSVNVPQYPPGISPLLASTRGIAPTRLSGRLSDVARVLGTNAPPEIQQMMQGQGDKSTKTLTREEAQRFLDEAKGDAQLARKLAREAGFSF